MCLYPQAPCGLRRSRRSVRKVDYSKLCSSAELHSKNRGGHIPPKSSHTASVTSHQGGLGVNSPPKRWWDLSRTTAKWERHTAKAEQGCVRIENGCTACSGAAKSAVSIGAACCCVPTVVKSQGI